MINVQNLRQELARYDPALIRETMFLLLRTDETLTEQIQKKKEWFLKHPDKQEPCEWFMCLNSERAEEILVQLTDIKALENTEEFYNEVHEAYGALPVVYHTILDELCKKKWTWTYLRSEKYFTNRRIKQLKDSALEALLKMM